ncbi:MAG: TIM barrel protein [Chloroflexi bacterium]|nr:TIM barrel protein [Chloroflexota bacterium]
MNANQLNLAVAGFLPADWRSIDANVCRNVRAAGFTGVSIVVSQPLDAQLVDAQRVRAALDETGVRCAQANGMYERLIDADPLLRAEGVRGHQSLTRLGRVFGAHCVYVRPGSRNSRGHWWHHPANHTAEAFDVLVASCKQIARTAEEEGMTLAIEGHVSSTLDTPQRARDLLDAVGSPALKFSMDPVNFIGTVVDAHDPSRVLNALFDLMVRDTVILHAKDCRLQDGHVVHIDEVLLGDGTMNYELLLTRLVREAPQAWLLIEHLPDEKIPAARAAIAAAADRCGVTFAA